MKNREGSMNAVPQLDRAGRRCSAAALCASLAIGNLLAGASPATALKPIAAQYQQQVKLSWRLTDDHGDALGSRDVVVVVRAKRVKTWRAYAHAVTDQKGVVRITARARVSSEFALRYSLGTGKTNVVAAPIVVDVSSLVTAAFSTRTVQRGSAATIAGSVLPTKPGAPVHLQRLVGNAWTHVATDELDSGGKFSFEVRATLTGRSSYRVMKPADSANIAGVSAVLSLLVR